MASFLCIFVPQVRACSSKMSLMVCLVVVFEVFCVFGDCLCCAALQDCGGGVTCTFEKVGMGITIFLCHRNLVAGPAFSFCACGCGATISVLWMMSHCRISLGTTSTSRILTVLC